MAVAAAVAAADWVAVARRSKPLEYVCKPGVMVALVGVALALVPVSPAQRWWFVAALVFGCAGDVFLMLPRDRFVPGLAAFLVGHLCYVVGFLVRGVDPNVARGVTVAVMLGVVGRLAFRVLRALRSRRELLAPVAAYMVVIAAMLVCAVLTGPFLALAGAVLFVGSDATIAEQRFLAAKPWHPLVIIVTYHVGQALLVTSLAV